MSNTRRDPKTSPRPVILSADRQLCNATEGVGLIDNTCVALLPFPAVRAELLLRERHQLDSKSFVEMRVWRVPRSVRASGHEFKYSLAYVVEGECVLRYDNEAGKGDHIHWADEDRSYNFTTPEQLLADFWLDVDTWRSK